MTEAREAIAEFFHTGDASHGHMWWSALKEADALLTALHAEGLVVVPVEPTTAMLLRGHGEVTDRTDIDESCWCTPDELKNAYRAMLTAANGGEQ